MSPTLELWGTIVDRLKADAGVGALIGDRVYDRVPADRTFPYASKGPSDELQSDAECIEAVEITLQIDVWSQTVGFTEASKVAAAIRNALHRYSLTLTTNALVEIEHRQTRFLNDPDPLTSHAAIEFVATVEVN